MISISGHDGQVAGPQKGQIGVLLWVVYSSWWAAIKGAPESSPGSCPLVTRNSPKRRGCEPKTARAGERSSFSLAARIFNIRGLPVVVSRLLKGV